MKKTVYIGFKFLHMGAYSGYDQVRFYADYDIFVDCQKHYNWLIEFLRSGSLMSRIYARIFGTRLWWIELYCIFLSLKNRHLVFHFIYAENIYRYLGWCKWLGFKIVCTYHQPTSFFIDQPIFLKGLQHVDNIIVLSKDLVQDFIAFKGDKNVHCIPHGVNTNFFCADSAVPRRRKVIMVGNWLRNFSFARNVFARLLQIDPEVHIHVVALKENLANFEPHTRLHLHCGISDEELLMHYRSAAVLFLPLDGFVANNAVLEVAAIGCPILVASEQKESPMPSTIVELISLSEGVAVKRILENLNKPDLHGSLRREWVLQQFDWTVIGNQTHKILVS